MMISFHCFSQTGDELLVYSVKGKVTVTYRNIETPVKVGKVLKQGTTIRMEKDARLTMVCKQGKPLSIIKEGLYPVSLWNDSCKNAGGSLTSHYFQYIWSELYKRSDEYKEGNLAVIRGDEPYKADSYPDDWVIVDFNRGLDTINYASGNFPLAWTCYDCNGRYQFRLYTSKDRRLVFKDSVIASEIMMSRFSIKLKPGISYAWTITNKAKTGVIRRRILNVVPEKKLADFIESIKNIVGVEEDSASQYFRIGFLLEKKHYLADAYSYYKKAVVADPESLLYRDKLAGFTFDFHLDVMEANKTGN
jgi:tetratricopeptide (TPR) repeat protein